MNLLASVGTVGLMFLALITNVMDDTSDMKPDTVIAEHHIHNIHNIRGLLGTILPLCVLQIADAATSDDQLQFLFQVFPSSRLQADTALLEKIICTAAGGQSIMSLDEIKAFNIEDSTRIWFIQAIGAFAGKPWLKMLCHLINVADASAIELRGNSVQENVYAAAAETDVVAGADQPAQVTTTALENPPAPVPNVALLFVPPKQFRLWNTIPNGTEKP